MVSTRQTLLWLGLVVGSFTWGCGGDPSSDPPATYTSTGTSGTSGTASTTTAGSTTGSGSTGLTTTGSSGSTSGSTGTTGSTRSIGYVRIAQLSPDLPAIDVCFGGGSTFIGPVVEEATHTKDLVSFGTVTNYLAVPAGTYEVRLVVGSSTSCRDTAGNVVITRAATVKAGEYATLAIEGRTRTTPTVSLERYADDLATPLGKTALRFIHAAPNFPSTLNTAVDVGLGTGTNVAPVFNNVRYTQIASQSSVVDVNGYAVMNPLSDGTITVRPAGSITDTLSVSGLALGGNQANTAFLVPQQATGPALLICADSKQLASSTVPKANCKIVH